MEKQLRPDTRDDYHERMLRVLAHIQQHLDDPISLEELAGVAHFSAFHFHRIFRGMVGESVMEHVRRLRLERAAHRLKFSDNAIVQIALEAGFGSHEAFTRAFRAMFDQSPTAFRREHRAAPYPPSASRVHFTPDADVSGFQPLCEGDKTMQVRIEQIDPVRVAYVRHVGPYDGVGQAWGRLFGWAGPRGLVGPATRYFGLCHDDPDITPPEKIRYDACLVVGPAVEAQGDIGVQDLPGGRYAVAQHHGPDRTLGSTYAMICGQWAPAHGQRLGASPSIERYLNDPRSTPEDELLTDVCVALG